MPIKSLNNPTSDFNDQYLRSGKEAAGPNVKSFSASGGTETTYPNPAGGTYRVHTFLPVGGPNTFVVSDKAGSVDILVVGAGGCGGSSPGRGGGGGAGAVIYKENHPATIGTHTITLGDGGQPLAPTPSYRGGPGGSTVALSLTAVGGGGGGGGPNDAIGPTRPSEGPGSPGACGGGGSGGNATGAPGGATTVTPGHPGAADVESPPTGWGNPGGEASGPGAGGAGGGGAGSAGSNNGSPGSDACGAGGAGVQYSIRTGSNAYYGAGGGGAINVPGPGCPTSGKQNGIGGVGEPRSPYGPPAVPIAVGNDNTGSGGGGGSDEPYAGGGGPGVVIIRYTEA